MALSLKGAGVSDFMKGGCFGAVVSVLLLPVLFPYYLLKFLLFGR